MAGDLQLTLNKQYYRQIPRRINPVLTRLLHVIYYHSDKKYPCLVGIELTLRDTYVGMYYDIFANF